MTTIAVYGNGQLGNAVSALLRANPRYAVNGPFGRADRSTALGDGADLVIIATTTRLREVEADIDTAVRSGANVLVSAEEAAFPWIVDPVVAERIDALARERGVSVCGAGVNPGLMFDQLVLTMLGAAPRGCTIRVRRNVDISGFGVTVLRRIGVGVSRQEFDSAVERGEILGHAGFPQSMSIVADATGVRIDRIDKVLRPVISPAELRLADKLIVPAGSSAGVDQTYTAWAGGGRWFVAEFFGHIDLPAVDRVPSDDIELSYDGQVFQTLSLRPGVNAQIGSANMVANSVERVLNAPPGWVTVAQVAPAFPAPYEGDGKRWHS